MVHRGVPMFWRYKWYTGSWSVRICDPVGVAAELVVDGLGTAETDVAQRSAETTRASLYIVM